MIYHENFSVNKPNMLKSGDATEKKTQSVFSAATVSLTVIYTFKAKLEHCYNPHMYACTNKYALGWWKAHVMELQVLSCTAQDILAALGASVPVEQLFSGSYMLIVTSQQITLPQKFT